MTLEVVAARVEDLSRRVHDIGQDLRANSPAVLAARLESISKDVEDLTEEVRGLRKAVIGFAVTVAASAVGFAITVVLVFGGN